MRHIFFSVQKSLLSGLIRVYYNIGIHFHKTVKPIDMIEMPMRKQNSLHIYESIPFISRIYHSLVYSV